MAALPPAGSSDGGPPTDRPGTDAVTRGFLFADLRGYTDFVERRGAAAAAELLTRYRELARREIERFEGAEIRTEGDSFYVVFASVGGAVRCGLAIVAAARAAASEAAGEGIRVGIGVHAGETVETSEGYVGQPVNIAARLCSMAAAGEVLVSDTVRALSRSTLPVRFVSRGRRRLKGIAEPVAVFAVEPIEGGASAWGGERRAGPSRNRGWRAALLGLAAVTAVGLGAIAWSRSRTGLPSGNWTVGVTLPLTGEFAPIADPLRRSVELAVAEVNAAGGIGGVPLGVDVRDTGSEDDPEHVDRGTEHAAAFIADPDVIGLIGPYTSFVAEAQIPITNEAGLLHCAPAATEPALTKPRAGALDLRAANPTRINFVRLAAAADIETAAAASFAFNDLGARTAVVIDDANDVGRLVADAFEDAFADLGGTVIRRALNPGADPAGVLEPLAGSPETSTVVFFGGFNESGGPDVRRAMVTLGYGAVPFLAWDGMWGGTGADPGSFIQLAGEAAAGSYISRPSVGTVRADFEQRYRAANGAAPSQFAGAAYACAEVIFAGLRHAATESPPATELREVVRAFVVDPRNRFETIIGPVSFDANGDSIQQFVTFYRVDPLGAGGAGDWVIVKQQDFGPAR